jgi:hypothetical protein
MLRHRRGLPLRMTAACSVLIVEDDPSMRDFSLPAWPIASDRPACKRAI